MTVGIRGAREVVAAHAEERFVATTRARQRGNHVLAVGAECTSEGARTGLPRPTSTNGFTLGWGEQQDEGRGSGSGGHN
jgi:hypothetical protein